MIVLQILFWVCAVCLLHTYVLFPLFLNLAARGKKQNEIVFAIDDQDLPQVTVLLAAYNEEVVIEEKIRSTIDTTYPKERIALIIGSDAPTDRTEQII